MSARCYHFHHIVMISLISVLLQAKCRQRSLKLPSRTLLSFNKDFCSNTSTLVWGSPLYPAFYSKHSILTNSIGNMKNFMRKKFLVVLSTSILNYSKLRRICRTYNPWEDFERMRNLGLFQSAPPDDVLKAREEKRKLKEKQKKK